LNGKRYSKCLIGDVKVLTNEQLQEICRIIGVTTEEIKPSPIKVKTTKPKPESKPDQEPYF